MAQKRRIEPWFTISSGVGNLVQGAGLLGGCGLVVWAARARGPWRTRLLLSGWLVTYFCDHAIGHWMVGRLLGIRFIGYGVHGTTAPDWYPPGVRWIFQHLPLMSARTDAASLYTAQPGARMAMYLAGTLLTLVTGLGIPTYGRAKRIAGAGALLVGAGVWFTPMVVVEVLREQGDLHRGWREFRKLGKRD